MNIPTPDHSTQIPGLLTQTLNYEPLFERLKAGHTLVTGNSRLSRVLTGQYNRWRVGLGDKQWQSPDVISWSLWLDRLWETASLHSLSGTGRAVPGHRQRVNLWEGVLRNEPLEHDLLRPESLAGQLLEARSMVVDWQLDFNDPAWSGDDNENHSAFHSWNKAFEKRCTRDNWISPENRTALLNKAIEDGQLLLPGPFDLLGFDEYSPGQARLLSTLIKQGSPVCHLRITSRQDKVRLRPCEDSKAELQQMARWVRYWHETEPDSTIAVVVPELQSRRQEVERQLEDILLPGADDARLNSKPWNISMGTPLVRVPMIEAAFDLLKLVDERVDIQDVGRVLRSPWIRGAATERNNRALLEKCLRERYPRQLKMGAVKHRADDIKTRDHHGNDLPTDQHGPEAWNSPEMSRILNTLIGFENDSKRPRTASAWAGSINKLLVDTGWPVMDYDPDENAIEHDQIWQALQSWRECLRELASLDSTAPGLSLKAAVNQLKQICREKVFQPHTAPANIQVLGLYEISGLRFDHLWVVGLRNDTWPASARPNPFIPAKLQRAARIPNSSSQRELDVAHTITRRLLETAPDCVFSYPRQVDGEEALPSPLISAFSGSADDDLPAWQGSNWRDTVASADHPQIDPMLMPGPLKHGTARGGSSILKHQALCPFRALASNRLGAEGLETPADGISPMLHGNLVHKVLELFWIETRTQAALLAMDPESLEARVQKHVKSVTSEAPGLNQRPAFRTVEARRITRHVLDYLELEKHRESFEVIGFEKEVLPVIEGQAIRLFIDRVDRLASGDEIIIDYKTGDQKPQEWFGDRPENPQLPLYAISAKKTPAGVVFGIIRDDGCNYKGVVKREGMLPGLPPDKGKTKQDLIDAGVEMENTIENWRQVLHCLMAEFLSGEAVVDPKHGTKTCENSYCDLQSLCRIGELEKRQKARFENDLVEVST